MDEGEWRGPGAPAVWWEHASQGVGPSSQSQSCLERLLCAKYHSRCWGRKQNTKNKMKNTVPAHRERSTDSVKFSGK